MGTPSIDDCYMLLKQILLISSGSCYPSIVIIVILKFLSPLSIDTHQWLNTLVSGFKDVMRLLDPWSIIVIDLPTSRLLRVKHV